MSIRNKNIPIGDIKEFHVTGVLYNSTTRFKSVYSSFNTAMMINIWRGSVWAVLSNGKRRLVKRVYN